MTDARARAEKDAPTFDRRKLLKVGAWAAPALLVAAAVPAASASGTGTPLGNTKSNATVAKTTAPGVGAGPNTVNLWYASVFYDYGQWGVAQDAAPQTMTVTYRVKLTKTDGTFVKDIIPATTKAIAKYGTADSSGSISSVAPGNYLVVTEVISNVFSPAMINGVTFTAPPSSSASSPVTVTN